jgi:ABC-type nickel/cobalt efflux system permease component RcnA
MYSIKVVKVAAKESFTHMLWLMAVIGIPMVYFSNSLDWMEKSALLLIALVLIWLLYLGLCFALHRFSLRKPNAKNTFKALDDIAKGKEIGSYLEGW